MKLRNKKTGEIKEWDFGNWYQRILNPDNKESFECTLSEFIDRAVEFREEWEDAPEEATQVYIEGIQNVFMSGGRVYIDYATAKEAEESVRKLKAWKRLKENGFRFIGLGNDRYGVKDIKYRIDPPTGFEENEDLHLLFGGGK